MKGWVVCTGGYNREGERTGSQGRGYREGQLKLRTIGGVIWKSTQYKLHKIYTYM